jgi:hypothetical protein
MGKSMGVWICLGGGIGIALGAAIHNIPIGLLFGTGTAVGVGWLVGRFGRSR